MHYQEIVTEALDAVVGFHERVHGLTFSAPDADLGGARVATQPDGSLIGVRGPLASHEQPLVRVYTAVADIALAAGQAVEQGATLAYGPARQGARGTFAILFLGGVQHGLWQP